MKLLRNVQFHHPNLSHSLAVTIGNFDGIHLGHQALIKQLKTVQQQKQFKTAIILFEPQPQEFFLKEQAPPRLMTFDEKLRFLKQFALDYVVVLRFNHAFSELSPKDFIEKIVVQALNTKYVLIGEDFHFGKNREGDIQLLNEYAKQQHFELQVQPTIVIEQQRVSSSRIRSLLSVGEFKLAEMLLGRPYSISGRVVYGFQRGRQLGFPTANVPLRRLVSPLKGVFVVRVTAQSFAECFGVANVGYRPTVAGQQINLEVHLFNFNQNIYGERIKVEFLHKVREEIRFPDLDALRAQIQKDVQMAKDYLTFKI